MTDDEREANAICGVCFHYRFRHGVGNVFAQGPHAFILATPEFVAARLDAAETNYQLDDFQGHRPETQVTAEVVTIARRLQEQVLALTAQRAALVTELQRAIDRGEFLDASTLIHDYGDDHGAHFYGDAARRLASAEAALEGVRVLVNDLLATEKSTPTPPHPAGMCASDQCKLCTAREIQFTGSDD